MPGLLEEGSGSLPPVFVLQHFHISDQQMQPGKAYYSKQGCDCQRNPEKYPFIVQIRSGKLAFGAVIGLLINKLL